MTLSPQFITGFGDSAVAAALSVVLACAFFASRNKNAALAMLLAFALAAFFITLAKIVFYGCWLKSSVTGLHSPSGHAAASLAVYGTFALIIAAPLKAPARFAIYLLTGAFVALIAATRVTLGYHSVIEVAFGLATGMLTCAIVWFLCLRRRPALINRSLFVAITLVAILLVHGIRLPTEAFIDSLAARLAQGCVKNS